MCGLSARSARHARRRASGANLSTSLRVIVVTDAEVGLAHLVIDEAMETVGRYIAVCGMTVFPASLAAPIGPSCRRCRGWVFAWQRGLLRGV
jgi:hypothetical protein